MRIAAASSTQDALTAVARSFERRSGHQVLLTFGSSGKLYHQITYGAPFDLFFSADDTYAGKLEASGLSQARARYAQGSLVLWIPRSSPVDPSRGMETLRDRRVRKVAIANPNVAPYGKAALEALAASGLLGHLERKLVLGENASQATHFVSLGAADAGILPLSHARSPRLTGKGRYWLLPTHLHSPLPAEAVILKGASETAAARDFLDFCLSPAGQALWRAYGMGGQP